MNELGVRLGKCVVAYRWAIVFGAIVAVALLASGVRYLSLSTDYRIYFKEDNPQRVAAENMEANYSKADNVFFVLQPADGNAFSAATLEMLRTLTERAWMTPFSTRVDSVTNFQYSAADGDDLVVRDLVEETAALAPAELEQIRSIALAEPALVDRLVSARGDVHGVNITIRLPMVNTTRETPEVISFSRALAREMEQANPGLRVRLTGELAMNNAFSEASAQDMSSLMLISLGVMFVLLTVFLRGLVAPLGTFCVVIFSILVALGLGGFVGVPLSPPSAAAPTIILTLAIASAVHVLVTLHTEMRNGADKRTAIERSVALNLRPVFWTSLTTALGFLSLNFSEVPPFQHLGNLVAVGVVASFVLCIVFLPALMALLPINARPGLAADKRSGAVNRVGLFVIANHRWILFAMLALVVFLASFVSRNELNDIFVHYFDERVQFRQDTDFTTANLTGLYRTEYALETGQSDGINDPAFLAETARFVEWLRAQPEVIHVSALTDIIKRINKNMHGDDPAHYRLPDQRNEAAQYLLLYEVSLPYGLDINSFVNVDKSGTRVTASTGTLSSSEIISLNQRALAWLATNASHVPIVKSAGVSLMFAHIGQRNIRAMLWATTIALLLISALLIVALRSVRLGLVSLIPNLVPAAMGFGLWGIMVGEVGLALSVVATVTLGIIVDDTIHFLNQYQIGRSQHGLTPTESVARTFDTVGRALVVTSCVLGGGFLVLAYSSFQANADLGLLTAIIIGFALLADFLLLPAVLIQLEERKDVSSSVDTRALDPGAT